MRAGGFFLFFLIYFNIANFEYQARNWHSPGIHQHINYFWCLWNQRHLYFIDVEWNKLWNNNRHTCKHNYLLNGNKVHVFIHRGKLSGGFKGGEWATALGPALFDSSGGPAQTCKQTCVRAIMRENSNYLQGLRLEKMLSGGSFPAK